MNEKLILGNKVINLKEVDSTNNYLQRLILESENEIEGLVVNAENQKSGKGQRGNAWESKKGKNLTFSLFLKPKLFIQNQFLLSKVISLGILDYLKNLGLTKVKIKWPNDIYCGDRKISGILIENSVRNNSVYNSIIGIGLNVNQIDFDQKLGNPTSICKELQSEQLLLEDVLSQLLFFIEKRYLALRANKIELINEDYLQGLYWFNEKRSFKIHDKIIDGTINGVESSGKIQVRVGEILEEFDLKEIIFYK